MAKKKQTSKAKIVPERLRHYAERFRNLPKTQPTQVGFEDAKGEIIKPKKISDSPSEWQFLNAGGYVHRVLRIGGFKEYENQLIAVCNKGGEEALWRELVTIQRARANLPYPSDWLQSFPEDCQLVADAIEREAGELTGGKVEMPQWSRALSCTKLAHIFLVSRPIMRRWLEEQRIPNDHISPRKWRVKLTELPADLVEKAMQKIHSLTAPQDTLS